MSICQGGRSEIGKCVLNTWREVSGCSRLVEFLEVETMKGQEEVGHGDRVNARKCIEELVEAGRFD